MADLSADDIELIILRAVEAEDVQAVVTGLEVLARVDMDRAVKVYETLRIGVEVSMLAEQAEAN